MKYQKPPIPVNPAHRFVRAVLTLALCTMAVAGAHGQAAFVRVNQLGYPTSSSKRAYLMSSGVKSARRSVSRPQVAAWRIRRRSEGTWALGAGPIPMFTP